MSIKTLYEGHYRALEKDFLELAGEILASGEQLTVVAAGSGQLDRLRELLLSVTAEGIIGGVKFLPGIRHLASELSAVPMVMETVSHADRTLFTLRAMEAIEPGEPLYYLRKNSETAHSMGTFFENLFEHGVTPEIYEQTSLSLSGEQTKTEIVIGRVFGNYSAYRRERYTCCGDMIMEQLLPHEEAGAIVFYGFYDLNPAQRRFLKRFFDHSSRIFWFSPLEENSQWNKVYTRTRKLLENQGIASIRMPGGREAMNPFANFFEALPGQSRPSVPADGLHITAVSGEMGASRAALKRIIELNAKHNIPFSEIAVIRRKIAGDSLVFLAHHEGVPTACSLKVKLSTVPAGKFVLDLARIDEGDFHYTLIEEILSSGIITDDLNPGPSEIVGIVETSGIRMGREHWRDWFITLDSGNKSGRLMRKLDGFYCGLPDMAAPVDYLNRLKALVEDISAGGLPSELMEALFDPNSFRWDQEISWKQFTDALRLYYQEEIIVLREGSRHGFQILTIEKARGSVFSSVILMDLEEGVYPRPSIEDPRLSDELRKKLQMTLKSEREIEDGYLLRQAGEAAGRTLDIIYRQRDAAGSEIYPSSFISNLVTIDSGYSPNPAWFSVSSSSAVEQMLGGTHQGQQKALAADGGNLPGSHFFASSFKAENSRMDSGGFDCYDGIFEISPFRKHVYTATMLESYVKCPFAYLAEKAWKLKERKMPLVSSSPDSRLTGKIVHEAVEEIISIYGFKPADDDIINILRREADRSDLEKKLGNSYLEEFFLEKQKEIIRASLDVLAAEEWKFIAREADMQGKIGNLDICGRIDLILEDKSGNLVVLDLKTGKLPSKKEIEKGKYYQLPFYYQMTKDSYPGKNISKVTYAGISAREPGRLVGYSGDGIEQIMDTVQRNFERIAKMMQEGIFPPISTGNCDYCNFKNLCRRTPSQRIETKAVSDSRVELLSGMMSKQ
jgi:RecB family exonuclease